MNLIPILIFILISLFAAGPDSESQEHFVLYAEDGRGGDPLEFKVESMQLTSLHYSYYAFWTYSVLLWMREVNRVYPAEEGQPRGLDFYVAKYKSLYPHQRAQDERVDDTYGPKVSMTISVFD